MIFQCIRSSGNSDCNFPC